MKNFTFKTTVLSFLILLILTTNCSDESLNKSDSLHKTVQLNDPQKKIEIKNWFSQKSESARIKNGIDVAFDFEDITLTTSKENTIKSYTAKQVDYNELQPENYSIGIYEINGEIKSAYIVKIIQLTANEKQIEYYDMNGNLLSTIQVNELTQAINVLSSGSANGRVAADCGQATMDCIDNLYTKAGWGSVFLTITSLITPATVVMVAATCAVMECSK